MTCHQWCECPKCSTFYDACMNEIPNPHTGTFSEGTERRKRATMAEPTANTPNDNVYITLGEGICYKPDGWTKKEYELFQDKMIEVAESFGKEVQFTTSWGLKTEAELDGEEREVIVSPVDDLDTYVDKEEKALGITLGPKERELLNNLFNDTVAVIAKNTYTLENTIAILRNYMNRDTLAQADEAIQRGDDLIKEEYKK